MDDLPPLTGPDDLPPVRTQADLHRRWRMLMGPLGFGRRSLWLHVLDHRSRSTPVILQVEDISPVPDPGSVDALAGLCGRLVGEKAPRGTVVFLLSRPGRGGATAAEGEWAATLQAAVRRAGLAVWPVHRANDDELRVCAPDELASSA